MKKLVIGRYSPEATENTAYYHIDKHDLTVTFASNKGIGDAIGRTMDTYMIYDDPKLVEGIANLWQYREEFKGKMVGVRHPDVLTNVIENGRLSEGFWKNRISRDHYVYTLVALKLWEKRTGERHPKLKEIIKATPFGIRRMARWTLELILWSKALVGNKFALLLYLIIKLFMVNVIYIPIRKLGYKLTGWGNEVDQEDWVKQQLQNQPKWHTTISGIVYPTYGILLSATQLYVIPNTFPKLKKILQKSLLKMVGKTNYVQQMLLGKKNIPRDKVEAFKSMKGGRWSGYLSNRNDRNMEVFPEGRYTVNLQDVDLVRHLYNETQLN